MNQQVWVGLDLGQRTTGVCIIDDEGKPVREHICETQIDQLEEALAGIDPANIGLLAVEAGCETHIVRQLRSRGLPVRIFDAWKASKFLAIRKNKSDASDARGLADLARIGRNTVRQVHLKSLECEQLRSLLVMRHKLVHLRVAAENAVRSRLAMLGLRLKSPYSPGSLRKQIDAINDTDASGYGRRLSGELAPIVDVCENLRVYLQRLDRELTQKAKSDDVCRRFLQVPGVGPICALSFYSAIEDPMRFQNSSDVGAYLGLVPRRRQSGNLCRIFGITKSGNRLTRSHLYTAATVFRARAPDCDLKRWAVALKERAGGKRSGVALARKLAIILLIMWKTGEEFRAHLTAPSPAS